MTTQQRPLRVGMIAMSLIIALAAIGVGSALWSETLTIDGTVETGVLETEFHFVEGGNADCVVAPSAGDGFTVTMTSAYPGAICEFEYDVWNIGTVPVTVSRPIWHTLPPAGTVDIAVDEMDCYPDGVVIPGGVPPTPGTTGNCHHTITVLDGADEGATYTFGAYVETRQALP